MQQFNQPTKKIQYLSINKQEYNKLIMVGLMALTIEVELWKFLPPQYHNVNLGG